VAYTVTVPDKVTRRLDRLQPKLRRGLSRTIDALAGNPFPTNAERMKGQHQGKLRIPVGGWRIVYTVDVAERMVFVLDVDTRGDIY
jgi:mRNA interferase RelE/StbE